jgi:hypothetical protein
MEMAFKILTLGEYHVLLWLHTAQDPSANEWADALVSVDALKQRLGNGISGVRSLAITDGGAPNSVQRQQLYIESLASKTISSAAVSTVLRNPVKRSIVTAILWLNPNFRVFPPDRFVLALEHLGLGEHVHTIFAELQGLQQQLSPSETLQLIQKHVQRSA